MECALMKCRSCGEHLSEDRIPRMLPCGHSLCEFCINQKLPHYKNCPECLKIYTPEEARHFHTNYPVLRLLRSQKMEDIFGSLEAFQMSFPSTDKKLDTWKCPVHHSPTCYFCLTCSLWICRDCLIVDHQSLPRGTCKIVSINDAIERLRITYKLKTKDCLEQVQNIKKGLDAETQIIEILKKYCSSSERSHKRLVLIINRLLDELAKTDKLITDRAMAVVKEGLTAIKVTTSPVEVTSLSKTLVDCSDGLKRHLAEEQERKKSLRQEILLHLKMDIRLWKGESKAVYAVLRVSSSRVLWSEVSQTERRLSVSSLREGNPPEGGIHIPYESVREMLHKNKPSVFFELGTRDETEGTVSVRLYRDCPRVRNIVSLCSGDKGTCYRGTSLFQMQYNTDCIFGGDLENNDGTGSDDTLDESDEYCPEEARTPKHFWALNYTYGSLSKFFFRFHCTYGFNIGRVTHGIEVLEILLKCESLSEKIVRECGFFIPRIAEEETITNSSSS